MSKAFDLDSLLDEALDDLDEHHVSGTPATTTTSLPPATTTTTTTTSTPSTTSSTSSSSSSTSTSTNPSQSSISELTTLLSQLRTRDDAQHLLGDLSDEKLMEFTTALAGLANMEQQGMLTPQTPTTTSTTSTSTSSATTTSSSSPTNSIDQAVKMISEGAKNLPPGGLPGMNSEGDLDQFLSKLMAEFEGSGGSTIGDEKNGDVDDMVEKMMGQMLSKECLYQPMKDIVDKYPSWLDEHKSTLSQTDYTNYIQQLTIFRKIITSFDTDPENTKVIFNLMQEMQAYGQPPKELIAGLLPPGMNMDEQGMPDFAAMAAAAGGPSALPPGFPPLGPNGMPDEAALKEFAKNECPTM